MIVAAVLVADQLSKWLVTRAADSLPRSVADIFDISIVHNTGSSFGRLADGGVAVVLIVGLVTLCLGAALLVTAPRYHLAVGLIFAGSVGNLIDRLRFGYVVDFVDAPYWPTFNVADIAIVVGSALLTWRLLTVERSE